jgi:hypothetical protein
LSRTSQVSVRADYYVNNRGLYYQPSTAIKHSASIVLLVKIKKKSISCWVPFLVLEEGRMNVLFVTIPCASMEYGITKWGGAHIVTNAASRTIHENDERSAPLLHYSTAFLSLST